MYHSFDVAVADVVGVNAAVLFQTIAFWCQHCEANGKNFHDGLYWTYSSNKAFREIFTYMTASQIDTALRKLIDANLVVKGNYNKSAYDRTMWYAVTEKGKSILGKSKMEKGKIKNPNAENREPIPNTINDAVEDTNTRKRAESVNLSAFDDFWAIYPKKDAKQAAIKAWMKLKPNDDLKNAIIAGVRRDIDGKWKGAERRYIPNPATYLNGGRWEDEATTDTVEDEYYPTYREYHEGDEFIEPEGCTPVGGRR